MASDPISIEVTYSAKDLRPFVFRSAARSVILTAIFIFVAVFVFYVVASRFLVEEISGVFRTFLVVWLMGLPLLIVVLNLVLLERVTRSKADRFGQVMLLIDETGVTSKEEHRTATLDWPAYKKAVEYRDKFVIFTNHGRGLLIPKRCFESEQIILSFKNILSRALAGKIEYK